MYKKYVKRWIDFLVALVAMPFVLIVFVIVAPIIVVEDKGPIFYNAPRVGKDGKVFIMYKFRSMRVDSPNIVNADGSTYNSESDPRVTKIGRILRKTSIDEIPQFINVLCGDMSLVGPRAHLTDHYQGLDAYDYIHKKRLEVRPGITGYNQAYYRNSVDSNTKLNNDLYYVEHLSFALDLRIFFKTIGSVVKRENIYVD